LTVLAVLGLLALLEGGSRLGQRFWPEDSPALQWSQGLALALVLLAGAAALLALSGTLHPGPIRVLSLPAFALLIRPKSPQHYRRLVGQLGRGYGAVCTFLWLGLVLAALAPNTHYDAQNYQYLLPRLYLERGTVYWTELGVFDGVFHGLHLLYAWAMGWAGELGANQTGPVWTLIAALALASLAEGSAGLAAVLVLSSPIVLSQGLGGMADLPAAACAALALATLHRREAPIWVWAAVSVKQTALIYLLPLCLAGRAQAWKMLLAAGVGALPWLIFNGWHSGNPLHPLGYWKQGTLFYNTTVPLAVLLCLLTPQRVQWPLLILLTWKLRWLPVGDPRQWQEVCHPLILVGALLHEGERSFQRWGLALGACLPIRQTRYLLGFDLLLAGLAARSLQPGSRLVKGALGVGFLIWLGILGPRWPAAWTGQRAFVEKRFPVQAAYEWLSGQDYQRVFLCDCQAFRCPLPFTTSLPVGPADVQRLSRRLAEQPCQLVLWDLASPKVRRALVRGAQQLELEQGVPYSQQWVPKDLPDWSLRLPALASEHSENLEWVYRQTWKGKVVFRRDSILAVEWTQ